jgi:FkbM family methyltransferase
MRAKFAGLIHSVLRRLPAARNVYAQRDALAAALAVAEAANHSLRQRGPDAEGRAGFERHARLVSETGFGSIAGFLIRIATDGPLGASGNTLLLPFDEAMYPVVVRDRSWQSEELRFLSARADPAARYTLLDIGANIGLFSRQAQRTISNIEKIICVEADPLNFLALTYNMAHLPRSAVTLHNIALAERAGQMKWYRDVENFGNYSLNADAMRDRPSTTRTIDAVEVGAFFAAHPTPEDGRIIWKSDTQGYDEAIITRVPDALWDRVDVAIIELWRIAKPAFDREALRRRLAAFPNRAIGLAGQASVAEVMDYLDGRDYTFSDLYLWR